MSFWHVLWEEEAVKKERIKIGVATIRRADFPAAPAAVQKELLKEALACYPADFIFVDDVCEDGLGYRTEDADLMAEKFRREKVDGIFIAHCDFGAEYVAGRLAGKFDLPLLLWGSSDGEIKNNLLQRYTMCGIFATGKIIADYQKPFDYIPTCSPGSPRFDRYVRNFIRECSIVKAFRSMKILQISTRPEPFWSVKYNEQELLERFGIEVLVRGMSEFVSDIKAVISEQGEELALKKKEIASSINCSSLSEKSMEKVAALILVVEQYFERYNLSGAAIQCWTALQVELELVPCAAFGYLCDRFMPVACETDVKGAIGSAMLQAAALYEEPVFFTDITTIHPQNPNACLLWHCGNFPCSLAECPGDACMENHPLQPGNPPAVGAWELRKGDITVTRFDSQNGKYTLMCGKGKAVPGPKVNGTYVWMEVDDWPLWEERLVKGPYIHHMSGVYADVLPAMAGAVRFIPGLEADIFGSTPEKISAGLRG